MIQPKFHFCPRCGKPLEIKEHTPSPLHCCSSCKFFLYSNQNLTTAAIIIREGKLLFTRRKINPHLGMLDLAGGYVEPLESPSQGMLREIREELGVEGKILQQLGVYGPEPYEFQGMTVYNASAHFQVDIGNQTPQASDDAASIEWIPLEEIDVLSVAFPGQQECLKLLLNGKLALL